MDEFGIVIHHHKTTGPKLAYVWRHGFGHRWLPYIAQHTIVSVWNAVACRIWGHDWFPDFDDATSEELVDGKLVMHGIMHDRCSSCSASREHDYDAKEAAL